MYYFIVNLKSRAGESKKIWNQIKERLDEKGVDYEAHITKYEEHAAELAKKISELPEKEINLVVVGGDGTMNEVLRGISDFSKIRFGYLPLGSGNDLARGLELEKDLFVLLDRILEGRVVRKMDLGCAEYGNGKKRYFAISAGIGIDAQVCKEAQNSVLKKVLNVLGLGGLTYICMTLKSLFTMPSTEAEVAFDGGTPRKIKKVVFVAGMNHAAEGGGVKMYPNASAFDGKLSVCMAYGISRLRAFFAFPFLIVGKQEKIKGFELIECKECTIQTKKRMVLHTDGEYGGMRQEIRLSCEKGIMRLME